jgi:hypothetical protein
VISGYLADNALQLAAGVNITTNLRRDTPLTMTIGYPAWTIPTIVGRSELLGEFRSRYATTNARAKT